MPKIQELLSQASKQLQKNKLILISLSFSFGLLFGVMINQGLSWQANLLANNNYLSEEEIISLFPEYQNIKEMSISTLKEINISTLSVKDGSFMVEFLATTGQSDVLHSYAFKIIKKDNQVINIKELPNP